MNTRFLPLALGTMLLTAAIPVFAAEPETSQETVDPAAYIIENAADYVTLGTYTGLSAEKQVYTVTDEEVEMEMDDRMYDYTYVENVTDRPAQPGDTLHVDLTVTVDGTEETMKDYEVDLGYEILGDAFDAKLLNASVGDTVTFQDDFTEDDYMTDWVGKTVDFSVTVKSIGVTIVPELTEGWVKENTDYDTLDAYTEAVRKELQDNYNLQADQQVISDLISQGTAASSFNGYPQEAYDRLYDQTLESYQGMADMFGMTLEETLEAYEISEEDLADDTVESMNRQLFLSAVAIAEGITVTEEDVITVAEQYYEDAGYESAQAFMNDYGADGLAPTALENKVGSLLLKTAFITEVPYEPESEPDELEWDEEDEDYDEDDEYWDEDDEDYGEDEEYWDEDDEDYGEDEEYWDEDDETYDEADEYWDEADEDYVEYDDEG